MQAATPGPIVVWSGWDHSNIGDVGHTPGLLRTLEECVPEARVILIANQTDARTRALLARRFPNVAHHEGGYLWGPRREGHALRRIAGRAALFIQASNMGTDTAWMDWLLRRGIPCGVYGKTFFPWVLDRGRETTRMLERVRASAFFLCRESLTLELLRSAGITSSNLAFAPDCCFGIDVRDDAGADALLARLGLRERAFITIHLRTITPAHEDNELPPGYQPAWNRPAPDPATDLRRADTFVHLVTTWVRTTGLRVLIAPEAKKEMAHNRRLIHDRLPEDVRPAIANLDAFWGVDTAASVFARASVVVCHEPHSPIIALAQGTPAVHTYSRMHSPKYHMFADIGLGDWLFEHDTVPPATLAATVLDLHANGERARRRVAAVMEPVHRWRRDSMAPVRRLLGLPAQPGHATAGA